MAGAVSGYGQADPADSSHPYNVQKFIVEQLKKKMVTAKVVRVVAVYSSDGEAVDAEGTGIVGPTGQVSVQPLVNLQDGAGNNQPHGIVHGVPFARTQGGANAVISDPQVGDIGIMVVADRDISSVKANRAQSPPGSQRTFDIADGMYVCSLLNPAAPTQWVRFRGDGLEFVDKNGNKTVTTPDGITTTDKSGSTVVMRDGAVTTTDKSGSVIEMRDGNITITPNGGVTKFNGDVRVTGELTGDSDGTGVGLNTHTHAQPADSHGDTEQETDPPTPGT